jgi:Sugar-transfer associated ATP-grasp
VISVNSIQLPELPLRNAPGLRSVYKQIRWLEQSSLRGKLRFLAAKVTRPARLVKPALGISRKHGPIVAQETGLSVIRQFFELWSLSVRHGFAPNAYYLCQLYRPHNRRRAAHFLLNGEYYKLITFLYKIARPDVALMVNKARFYEVCRDHGLPTAPVLVEFENGSPAKWHEAITNLPPRDLFSKPSNGIKGKSVARWIFVGDDCYRGEDGSLFTQDQLLNHLSQLSRVEPYILQPKLANHSGIATLSSGGLCTARVITFRKFDGPAEYLIASFRMPSGNSPADNFSRRGLAAAIDEKAGRLHSAVRMRPDNPPAVFAVHPDTNGTIAGVRLPYWNETVQLCLRAQDIFSKFLCVGWDVAITEQGPLLLEGNYDWGTTVIQQPHDHPIGLTKLTEFYLSCLSGHALGG